MLDVLCPLITESDIVSNELLDIILMNIVEPNKTQKKNAYLLAKELVNKCSDTLEPYIQAVSLRNSISKFIVNQYFIIEYFCLTTVFQSRVDLGQRGKEFTNL